MEKVIIILDGFAEGKNSFLNTIKDNGYWVWNINVYNVLSMVTHKLGYEGDRNNHYYDFVNKFKDLADEYFDFERNYTNSMIRKFMDSDKANVLVIHNCDNKLAVEIQDFYENIYDIYLSNKNEDDNESYCKTLNYLDLSFTEDVLKLMKTLTKSFEKGA